MGTLTSAPAERSADFRRRFQEEGQELLLQLLDIHPGHMCGYINRRDHIAVGIMNRRGDRTEAVFKLLINQRPSIRFDLCEDLSEQDRVHSSPFRQPREGRSLKKLVEGRLGKFSQENPPH